MLRTNFPTVLYQSISHIIFFEVYQFKLSVIILFFYRGSWQSKRQIWVNVDCRYSYVDFPYIPRVKLQNGKKLTKNRRLPNKYHVVITLITDLINRSSRERELLIFAEFIKTFTTNQDLWHGAINSISI